MSDSQLEIFELCDILSELLGERFAIADMQILLERHTEMFKNREEVSDLIKKVVSDPDIIIKNPTPKSKKDYMAGKKLNDKKMGEVGIRKDENINKIFHANEKNVKKIKQLYKKEVVYRKPMVGTPNSYTQAQSLDERLVQKNISSAIKIIAQENKFVNDFKAESKDFNEKDNILQIKKNLKQ